MTTGATSSADPDTELDALVDLMLGQLPKPVDWRRIPAHAAAAEWAALDTWVRWLAARYALDHRELPPCWFRHAAVVEELSALRTAHASAFHPTQPAPGPLDWHQSLGYTRLRMRDWVARTGCKPGGHRGDTAADWTTEPTAGGYGAQLQAFIADDEQARREHEVDSSFAATSPPHSRR